MILLSWLLIMLCSGYKVRGTVRNLRDEKKIGFLKALPKADINLELVGIFSIIL